MDETTNEKKKINFKAVIAVIVCTAVIIGIVSVDLIRNSTEYETTAIGMGTVINLKLIGPDGEVSAKRIEDEINSTEKSLLSWREKGSDVERINASAGKAVSVSKDTADIIAQSLFLSKKCNGVFDITIGKITQMWDFGGENQRVPSKDEIYKFLPSVGYSCITISGNSVTVGNNQALDLGAIGKGAACDRIKKVLANSKTKSAVVSVGGSLLLYGKKDFTIGIINPDDDSKYMGTLNLSDVCISTSGDYEKTFNQNGKTYHHILDAHTGYPAQSELSSVTVVCSSGLTSDALSTACFILGYDNSLKLLNEYGAQAVFIFKDNTVKYTDGLADNFKITDDNFKVTQ